MLARFFQDDASIWKPKRRRLWTQRQRLWTPRQPGYFVADLPPINTALSTTEYGTDGVAYTAMLYVLNVEPTGRVAKVIERRRKGIGIVEKFTARIDHGSLKITQEYASITFAVWDAFFLAKTPIYIRDTMDDAGTSASKVVYYGPISGCDGPNTPGDDADQEFVITQATQTVTFTAGT